MLSTYEDNQTSVVIRIFEGDRAESRHNRLLGEFELHGIQPSPSGQSQIEVIFETDFDDIIQVTFKDKGTGSSANITIERRIGKVQLDNMLKDADSHKEEDHQSRAQVDSRFKINPYLPPAVQVSGSNKGSTSVENEFGAVGRNISSHSTPSAHREL